MPSQMENRAEGPLLSAVLNATPDLVCLCRDGVIVAINPAGAKLFGLGAPDDAIDHPLADFAHPDFVPLLEDGLDALVSESGPVPFMVQRPDGQDVEMEFRVEAVPGRGVLIHGRDLSERTRAAHNLVRSEKRYRRLIELVPDCICLLSEDGITYINPAGLRELGVSNQNEVVGHRLADFIHPDYQDLVAEGMDDLAEEGGFLPLILRRPDGEHRDVEVAVSPFEDAEDGGATYMVEIRDITERKQAAEALHQNQRRLQGIMNVAADGIITIDHEGTIQSVNPAAESIFQYTSDELIGQDVGFLAPEPVRSEHPDYVRRYRETGEARILGVGREVEGQRKDGTIFPLDLSVTELWEGEERLFIGMVRDITERKQAEEALKQARDELEQRVEERTRELRQLSRQNELILNSANEGILGFDVQGHVTFANPAVAEMLGMDADDMVGRPAREVLRYGDQEGKRGKAVPVRAAFRRGHVRGHGEAQVRRRDGRPFPAEYAVAPISEGGEIVGAVAVLRDITDRKRAEETMQLARTVFENTGEGVMVLDAEHQVTAVNPAFIEMTGYRPYEVLGESPDFMLEGVADELWDVLHRTGHWVGEMWTKRQDGTDYAQRLSISAVRDESGNVRQYVALFSDITQRKLAEERMRYQANYDNLTGLPNRTLFQDRLAQGVATAEREGDKLGLLFVDLDGFKQVNDTLGHDAGDLLLKEGATRLGGCIRGTDTLARLGGDEFTVVMPHLDDPRNAPIVARRIIDVLDRPFDLDGQEGTVSASIGIAVYPDDAEDADELVRAADAAMYKAKQEGKANYQFYAGTLNAEAEYQASVRERVVGALERGELHVVYQPRVRLNDDCVAGFEALARWHSPELGEVSPERFLPALEERTGADNAESWVLDRACETLANFRAGGAPDVTVSINLSSAQVRRPDLVAVLRETLEQYAIPAASLEVEVSEAVATNDPAKILPVLEDIRGLGAGLVLDGFGAGEASAGFLRRCPADVVKLDRDLVGHMPESADACTYVSALVGMIHGLGRRAVAVGVETEEQRVLARRCGCDEVQGFLTGVPGELAEAALCCDEMAAAGA